MKKFEVTFKYKTTVAAEAPEEAKKLAYYDFELDCLECTNIQEKENDSGIIFTKDINSPVPEGKHMVQCECCDCYLIYSDSDEKQLYEDIEKENNENYIRCPVCDDLVVTYGVNNFTKEYFDNRIE